MKGFKCNGYSSNAHTYPKRVHDKLVERIQAIRPTLNLEIVAKESGRDLYRGSRFNDDERVMLRMRSAYSAEEAMANPDHAVTDALVESASADHWYTFEKQWD